MSRPNAAANHRTGLPTGDTDPKPHEPSLFFLPPAAPALGPPANVIESIDVVVLPDASVTEIVMSFVPGASGIDADQDVVPVAVPLCPVRAFDHVTCVTPPASEAVPLTVRGDDDAGPDDGDVIDIVGGVVSPPPPGVV